MKPAVSIDVVICTFNRAPMLARVLDALARQQRPRGVEWSVLVVDNNCTDGTAALVDGLSAGDTIPGLRRVLEPEQGLTPARQRGVLETEGDWIAFVDDDCLLADDWIAEAGSFLSETPGCGGMGGRVTLDFEDPPPPFVSGYGWALAQQEHGMEVRPVDCLVGAGMVVRREALILSGWLDAPLLDDRVGERLVSGGDVELALRVRSAGYPLWYNPACKLRHFIPSSRLTRSYLRRVIYGLGISSALASALEWSGPYAEWRRGALRGLVQRGGDLGRKTFRAIRSRRGFTPVLFDAAFTIGSAAGLAQVLRMSSSDRDALMGRAASGPSDAPQPSYA